MHFDAIVLAGGLARRLGGVDKPMLAVGGAPMLQSVLAAVSEARIRVVVGPPRDGVLGVRWAREQPPGAGPVAALAAGLDACTAPVVVVLAADMPRIAPAVSLVLGALAGEPSAEVALLVRDGRDQYLAAAWRRPALVAALAAAPAVANAALRVLYSAPLSPVRVPDEHGWTRDVDTREDFNELSG